MMEKAPSFSARTRRKFPAPGAATADIKDALAASMRRRKASADQIRTAAVKPRSAAVLVKERSGSHTVRSPTKVDVDKFDDDGITFTNVESRADSKLPPRQSHTMTATEILERCQETDYREVYDINLRSCHLTETPNLEKFSKVRVIDLSSNHIETISRLECCEELRELKFYDNQLKAIDKLDALTDLNSLQLQHNSIAAVGRGLVNCRKLITLRLDYNKLTRLDNKEMASLSKLTSLDLSNNRLDNINALNSLPNLLELSVCNNRLRSVDLPRCKKIEEVDLSGNKITELNCLAVHSSSLKILNVSRNAVSKIELSVPLSRLEELYISHNMIKRLNNVPSKLPALQILDLSHNHIRDDKELLCLQECSTLRELDLTSNPFELNELGQVETNPAEIIPTLQVLDGMVTRKPTTDNKAPLMRPMSASHVISARQVQSHLETLEVDMKSLQGSLEEKFRTLRVSLGQLPSRPTSAVHSSDRPASRGSRRSRIMEAKAFAAHRYSDS